MKPSQPYLPSAKAKEFTTVAIIYPPRLHPLILSLGSEK
ncbi:hypothetical protein UF75_1504 [Desulfosporosinus sp. I2]|nr:hypothetical protein UF75_1504 [Desulfosporosinus sp. I2]